MLLIYNYTEGTPKLKSFQQVDEGRLNGLRHPERYLSENFRAYHLSSFTKVSHRACRHAGTSSAGEVTAEASTATYADLPQLPGLPQALLHCASCNRVLTDIWLD